MNDRTIFLSKNFSVKKTKMKILWENDRILKGTEEIIVNFIHWRPKKQTLSISIFSQKKLSVI